MTKQIRNYVYTDHFTLRWRIAGKPPKSDLFFFFLAYAIIQSRSYTQCQALNIFNVFFSTLIATFPTYLPQCGFASFWNIVLLFVSFSFCFVLMTFANFPFFIYIFYTVFRFLTAVFCANICLVVGALIRNQSSNGIILLLSSTSPPIYLFW